MRRGVSHRYSTLRLIQHRREFYLGFNLCRLGISAEMKITAASSIVSQPESGYVGRVIENVIGAVSGKVARS
jgi:hypothetical protein